ncbi:MAG TPA: alpha-ketoglutarate-dependent dioxygenase AlkB [Sphingomicrobium sp.]
MSLLFDTPLIAGLRYQEDVLGKIEEYALLDRLRALDLPPFRFHGWLGNRKTLSFGWRYDFEDLSFTPAEPIPDWMHSLRERAAVFAGLETEELVHALVARYDPGAGIGWHRDRDIFEKVVGISLNTPTTLRFRLRSPSGFRRAKLEVEPRSAYLLSGDARHDWEHSISPGGSLRFSITFRSLSEKGRRVAARQGARSS